MKNIHQEISLKLDIAATCKVMKIADIHVAIARILHLIPSAIQLVDIDDGCVVVKFRLQASIADMVFTKNKKFSPTEEETLRSLKVLWLEYDDRKFKFRKDPEIGKLNMHEVDWE